MTGWLVVAWQMCLQVGRAGILWLLPLYGALSLLVLPTVADLSLGAPHKGQTDVGLFLLWLTGSTAAILIGTLAIGTDLREGAVLVLYRPISRATWVVGRITGAALMLAGVTLGLSAIWIVLSALWGLPVPITFVSYALLLWIEWLLVAGVAGLLSAAIDPAVATLLTVGVWATGHLTGSLETTGDWAIQTLASRVVLVLVPDLQRFDLQAQIVHRVPVAAADVGWSCLYGAVWTAVLVALTVGVVSRRDLT